MSIMLIGVTLLFVCIFGFQLLKKIIINHAMRNNTAPVITVSAMSVHYEWWQPLLLTYGSLRAVQGVNVTTELAGLVRTIYFKPGSEVKAGDVLVQLNADSDIALLHALEAQEKLAEIIYHRDSAQFAIKAISKAILDSDQQNLKNLQAQVSQQAATVAKKTLVAPFTGRLGISAINPGQYVNAGDQVVTLQALDPLYADFFVPQQNLIQLHIGSRVKIKTDTYPNKTFTGIITTINPIVDVKTRNVEVEATIENPHFELYPGMFVSTEVETGANIRYLTLPQTAISFNPYGEIAYIVQKKGKDKKGKSVLSVLQTFVVTGDKRGDQIVVLEGLKEGDIVVTSGQLKLKNGSLVVINNTVVPQNKIMPMVLDE
ncbi:MAG: efflux RND transporter periplasmic adaptor subunit [Rickettsiella sp.]|nr:efflux RND transporter periplasmic adaptor subunit [Rickettsiella sp.]